QNPASLSSLRGIQVSVGGLQHSGRIEQIQHYAPVKYYSNLSLLLEGLTGQIPDPADSLQVTWATGAKDTIQRPFDSIGPNWASSASESRPIQAFLAVPFKFGEAEFVAGAGVAEYADLDYYYQQNNVLSPSILSERPLPTPRPPNDATPTLVDWSQYLVSREGFIRGYGLALSGSLPELGITAGVSGMILQGESDDFEQSVSRGRMTFFTNSFRLDSAYGRVTKTTTSEYTGEELSLAFLYSTKNVTLGFTVKPPTRIARSFTSLVSQDSTGVPSVTTVTGKDRVRLPWRGSIGLALVPREDLVIFLQYDIRPYESAGYKVGGTETFPWMSSSTFGIGVGYQAASWLQLRGGIRGRAEVFEQEGNPLPGEPVSTSVYSAGAGIRYGGMHLNVVYEYSLMKYQDVWGSAISLNKAENQLVAASLAYEIPWEW
ncbi:MAG TPA: hypothetical protein VGA55_02745, partial [Bacteroidota bacterium]